MKAQASVEFLIVIAISFLAIIPTTYFLFNFSKDTGSELIFRQIDDIGFTFVDTAESVFFTGQGTKTTISVTIPEEVQQIDIVDQRELVFNISTQVGESQIVFISKVNMTTEAGCGLGACLVSDIGPGGNQEILFQALAGQVLIKKK